jgi:ribose transport system ATP-binding protein
VQQPGTPVPGRALVCTDMVKSYAGVTVLKSVSLTVPAGEVVGLIGENGAGKSTLSSIIAGVVRADSGTMTLDGEPYAPHSPHNALDRGVALIHQEIRMVPQLSVAENIFLGRLPTRGGRVDSRTMFAEAEAALGLVGIHLDPRRKIAGLSMAAQQGIEIAKALARKPKYVIFDEPSASLTEHETDVVLHRIEAIRKRGAGVIYISHRLEEVRSIAQEIVCLRDGQLVRSWTRGDVPVDQLMAAMVGRDFEFEHQAPEPAREHVVLEVRNLGRRGAFEGVSFRVAAGEILGIAGLVGAGRTEMVRTIADQGEILLEGQPLRIRRPKDSINVGIVMVPEDRKGQGLNLGRNSAENIVSPWERILGRTKLITPGMLGRIAAKSRKEFDIRGRMDLPVVRFSGGNQQKVLLAKWLVQTPKVLILDEPTRGVDVGAKMAIYEIVRKAAETGVAVLVVSSELEEVLGLSHRVLVMSGGRMRKILARDQADSHAVMELAVPTAAIDESNVDESNKDET